MYNRNLFPTFNPKRPTHSLFNSLNSEIARVFDEFDSGSFPTASTGNKLVAVKLDYSESEDNVELKIEVPGFAENDIDVELNGRVLSVSGKRETRKEEDKKNYRIIERESGNFSRSITLDFDAHPEKINAHVDAGILTVSIEKPEEKKTKRQKISVKNKSTT